MYTVLTYIVKSFRLGFKQFKSVTDTGSIVSQSELSCHVVRARARALTLAAVLVHARVLTGERAQLAGRSRRLTDGVGLTRTRG